jgi:4-amino-4-deoxy-L-arabinose transferase-like glycosyltransferase
MAQPQSQGGTIGSGMGVLGLPGRLLFGLLVTLLADRLWFLLDTHMPAWDEADYLNGALAYGRLLGGQGMALGSDVLGTDFWRSFWQLAPKIPPLVSVLTVPFLRWFGPSADSATGLITLLTLPLVWVVYDLGSRLFKPAVGLWGAGLCLLLPGLYGARLEYMLDYPVTVGVTVALWGLTRWWWAERRRWQWVWAIAGGLLAGLALLTKQTALLFLLGPMLWTLGVSLYRRRWERLGQWLLAGWLARQLLWPWWTTNWLLILSSNKRASLDSALKEGDPSILSWQAWTYYLQQLPHYLSWPLMVGAIAGLLFWCYGAAELYRQKVAQKGGRLILPRWRSDRWLWGFVLVAYGLCSLSPNKDDRYFLPVLPIVSLILARGLLLFTGRLKAIRWGLVCLVLVTMVVQLFPLVWPLGLPEVQRLANVLSPGAGHPVRLVDWPHEAVIAEILRREPYLQSTLGVLPSTAAINQHNVSFIGGLRDFQVQGRQVGVRQADLDADRRSLDWFLTKTGDQGSIPASQAAIVAAIATDPDFEVLRSWPMADGSTLNLHHRIQPLVEVLPLEALEAAIPLDRKPQGQPLQLALILPKRVTPNQPVPVTYEWSGTWSVLHRGIVLLSWLPDEALPARSPQAPNAAASAGKSANAANPNPVQANSAPANSTPPNPIDSPAPASNLAGQIRLLDSELPPNDRLTEPGWIHDHGIALGFLKPPPPRSAKVPLRVTERMAMLSASQPGRYRLEARYLDRLSRRTIPLAIPPTTIEVTADAIDLPAPELDWLTQLRQWAQVMPEGIDALGPVFESIARVNQYDPFQDYLTQAALSLETRLQQKPWVLNWAYSQALAQVIRRNADGAIEAFHHVAALDSSAIAQNYLAFVQLYDLNPREADRALTRATSIEADRRETYQLSAVSALFQWDLGRLIRVAQNLRRLGT